MKGKKHYIAAIAITAILLTYQGGISICAASEPLTQACLHHSTEGDTLQKKTFVYAHSSDGYVNVRKKPSTSSDKLGELRNGGAGALYLGREGSWLKVLYHGEPAYVYSLYAQIGQSSSTSAPVEKHYFYIVIASFENAELAKKTADELPDIMRRPVYRHNIDGNAKYRICESCFTTRDKALTRKKELDIRYGESDIWIWETSGLADCIYCPTSTRQGNSRIVPLSPR